MVSNELSGQVLAGVDGLMSDAPGILLRVRCQQRHRQDAPTEERVLACEMFRARALSVESHRQCCGDAALRWQRFVCVCEADVGNTIALGDANGSDTACSNARFTINSSRGRSSQGGTLR